MSIVQPYLGIRLLSCAFGVLVLSGAGGSTALAEDSTATATPAQADSILSEIIVLDRVMVIGDPDKINDIPGSAHYIGQARLAKQNYNDILRILREVPGVNIQDEEGYGLRPNIGMRGTGVERSAKITLMEDGILMAPAPYVAPAAYYFPTAGRMQSIEVRKGSSQIKHGPYTTGGALNLISTAIPDRFSGRANLSLGQDGSHNIHTYAGDAYENFGWMIESYQANTDGYKVLDGGGDTGFDKEDYLAKFRVNTRDVGDGYQELLLKLGRANETSNETYLGLTDSDFARTPYRRYAGSQMDLMTAEQEQVLVRYFIQANETLDFTTALYHTNFHRNWYKLDRARASLDGDRVRIGSILKDPIGHTAEYDIITGATSPNDNALEVKANNRSYYARGAQATISLRGENNGMSHALEIGFRLHEDQIDRFQWVDKYRMDTGVMKLTDAGAKGTESNRVETATAFASFAQYKFTRDKWLITPGIRYENIKIDRRDYGKSDPDRSGANLTARENKVSVWIPGLGVNYKLPSGASVFAGVHKGFSPPGSRAGTRPEDSIGYEVGLRYRKNTLRTEAIVYLNNYDNLLGADLAAAGGSGSGDLFNGGGAVSKGLEFELRYDPAQAAQQPFSLPIRLVYTFTSAQFRSNFDSEFDAWGTVTEGDELPYIPRHQYFINVGLNYERWGLDLGGKYSSRMRTEPGSGAIAELTSTDAAFVVDFTAEFKLTERAKLFGGVRNLTDRTYITARRPAGVRPGLPRRLIGGVKTDF